MIVGLIGVLAIFILLKYFYEGLINPLSHIPGPYLSRWTNLKVSYYWLAGKRASYVDELHKQYGPVVRISPNEVDICDIRAARDIYKTGSRFYKSNWYRLLIPPRLENIISTPDPLIHSFRRRLLAPPLSDSSLTRFEPRIRDMIYHTLNKMSHELKEKGSLDVFKWWLFMTTDIIGELSFGESFRMLEKGEKTQYSIDLEQLSTISPMRTTFPFLMKVGAMLPLPIFTKMVQASNRLNDYARQSVARHKAFIAKDPLNAKHTLFTKVIDAGDKGGLSEQEICNEARGFIGAGSDTTAVTLTYLVYAVCRDCRIRDKLVSELMEQLPDGFTDRDTRSLPYLNQVIKETLRLYAAVPEALPRTVPEEGSHLAGFSLPGGTTVSTQAYSMHRDPRFFPNPLNFYPERWTSPTKEMEDASLPFGGGSRTCLGIHLARIELRLATALFFRAFPEVRMSSREGMCDDDMELRSFFLAAPKGHRCLVEA
ncbi:cytochrome P450 [Aspergillus vadensis CBS 113365]|uniref:Cytochrome P450 n=1 Tax=Aspergillus vadensis (strain CBS 113365 / IMI 142717 / IBT 24658) TaxID=1448311 RepID=A0A319BL37_ASPVC|nr:cytochrome P450 [Aspergillus vadensis CBS 113365]PYH73427.1 cytochrome P450 [Aspergillus vadensis CBS 113365]